MANSVDDQSQELLVYTDGSCATNQSGRVAGYGVYFGPGHKKYVPILCIRSCCLVLTTAEMPP